MLKAEVGSSVVEKKTFVESSSPNADHKNAATPNPGFENLFFFTDQEYFHS